MLLLYYANLSSRVLELYVTCLLCCFYTTSPTLLLYYVYYANISSRVLELLEGVLRRLIAAGELFILLLQALDALIKHHAARLERQYIRTYIHTYIYVCIYVYIMCMYMLCCS